MSLDFVMNYILFPVKRRLENEGGYRWFDPFGSTKKTVFLLIIGFENLEFIVLTGTLDIATDNEPQPFVSNGSGTETDETVS